MLSSNAFFFSTLEGVIRRYPIFFGIEDRENSSANQGGSSTIDWFETIDHITKGRREQWDYIMEMPIVEFFNTLSIHTEIKKRREKRLSDAIKGGFESYVVAALNELL